MVGIAAVAGAAGWGIARVGSQKPEKQSVSQAASSEKTEDNRYASLPEMEQVSSRRACLRGEDPNAHLRSGPTRDSSRIRR